MVRRGNERPDGSLWRPWLRIDRILRVMLHTRWSVEAWSVVRVEFRKAIALKTEIGAWGGSTSRWLRPRLVLTYPVRCAGSII
jgi:hypothetical protein